MHLAICVLFCKIFINIPLITKILGNRSVPQKTLKFVMASQFVVQLSLLWILNQVFIYYLRPPSLSELSPIISNIELTHLGSEAFIFDRILFTYLITLNWTCMLIKTRILDRLIKSLTLNYTRCQNCWRCHNDIW